MFSPNEQLGEAHPNGAVSMCAFADVVDVIDVFLQGLAVGLQLTKLSDDDDLVTVVQRPRVPGQNAVTSVVPGNMEGKKSDALQLIKQTIHCSVPNCDVTVSTDLWTLMRSKNAKGVEFLSKDLKRSIFPLRM